MLKDILTISGRTGLYKMLNQGNNMIIVESLISKERFPVYSHERISSLHDISIYTTDGDVPLKMIFEKIKEKESSKLITFDIKKASKGELQEYFRQVLPNFDEDRVYPTDIQKALKWYNILIENGVTDFGNAEEPSADESKNEYNDKVTNDPVQEKRKEAKRSSNTQTKKLGGANAKTGIGTRKG